METNPQRDSGQRQFLVVPAPDGAGRQGDGLVTALELVLTTTIFAALGFWLDQAVGTTPFFTFVLGTFTLAYGVWKIIARYDAEMAAHTEQRQPLRQGPVR